MRNSFGDYQKTVENECDLIEAAGYNVIELRYTKSGVKRRGSKAKFLGFEVPSAQVMSSGNKIAVDQRITLIGGPVIFYPDRNNVNYGYVPDTEQNRLQIANNYKVDWYAPTDARINEECKKIAVQNELPTEKVVTPKYQNLAKQLTATENRVEGERKKEVAKNRELARKIEELEAMLKEQGVEQEKPLSKTKIDKSKLNKEK